VAAIDSETLDLELKLIMKKICLETSNYNPIANEKPTNDNGFHSLNRPGTIKEIRCYQKNKRANKKANRELTNSKIDLLIAISHVRALIRGERS
jgi:hypothetical protein